MLVNCRLLSQEAFSINVESNATVGDVKQKIEELKGSNFKADTLKLIYAGKVWDSNESTIESQGYKESGFIVVMTRKPSVKPDTSKTVTESSTPTESQTSAPQSAAPPAQANPQQPASASPADPALPPQGAFGISPEKYNEMVQAIVSMGYPKSEVESALRASYFSPERAVEYLISGIPPSIAPPLAPSLSSNPAGGALRPAPAAATGAAAVEGADPLAFFRNSPQLAQMRQMIQQDPQLLQNFMQDIGQANPALLEAIRDHEEDFLALINADQAEGDEEDFPEGLEGLQGAIGAGGAAAPPGVHYLNVTTEENAAIERLKALGFPEQMVIEAFFACEKNEEMAANLLLSNLDEMNQG